MCNGMCNVYAICLIQCQCQCQCTSVLCACDVYLVLSSCVVMVTVLGARLNGTVCSVDDSVVCTGEVDEYVVKNTSDNVVKTVVSDEMEVGSAKKLAFKCQCPHF